MAFFASARSSDFLLIISPRVLASPLRAATRAMTIACVFINLSRVKLRIRNRSIDLLHRMLEDGFAEVDLSKGAPDLDLGDVVNVLRDLDRLIHLVSLDHQLLQEIGVTLGVNYLPVRIRCLRRNKVVREREHALATFGAVSDEAGVRLFALKGLGFVSISGKAIATDEKNCDQ